jgi:NAD(P)-dependent dehydrogenase (short-subunit alcohol dehydrogenase family)
MRDYGFGRIVNISSLNAQKGQAGQTNYCAAKAGVSGFTRALALETAGKGVTVGVLKIEPVSPAAWIGAMALAAIVLVVGEAFKALRARPMAGALPAPG